jgi:hypothetical protein
MGAGHASRSLFREDADHFRGLSVPAVYQADDTYVDHAGRNVGRYQLGKCRSCSPLHRCSGDRRSVLYRRKGGGFREISFAVQESAVGTSRHFATTQRLGGFRSEADINSQIRPAVSVAFGPKRALAVFAISPLAEVVGAVVEKLSFRLTRKRTRCPTAPQRLSKVGGGPLRFEGPARIDIVLNSNLAKKSDLETSVGAERRNCHQWSGRH